MNSEFFVEIPDVGLVEVVRQKMMDSVTVIINKNTSGNCSIKMEHA
jgi:hypothetical protein